MKTLYITDLDGTFLNTDAQITDLSKKLVKELIGKGADFTLATARTFATVTEMFADVNLTLPMVLMNGVMLYDPAGKRIISSHSIDFESVNRIIEVYKKHGLFPLVYHNRGDCLEIKYFDTANKYQMAYVDRRTEVGGKKFTYSPSFCVSPKDEIIYLVTLDKYEIVSALYNEIKEIESVSSVFYKDNYTDCYFLEIFAKGVSKASGLREVRKLVGADKVIAFGDNLNDMEMFRAADEAYAVSNACHELKEAATAIIGANSDDSVARFIYNHFCGEDL